MLMTCHALKGGLGKGVPRIRLEDEDEEKWAVLCAAVKDKLPECKGLVRGKRWPTKHTHTNG